LRLHYSERNKLGGRVKTHLLADVLAVIVHREDAQVQRAGNLSAGLALTNHFKYFLFPWCEHVVGLPHEGRLTPALTGKSNTLPPVSPVPYIGYSHPFSHFLSSRQ
jgi:hypothetical protein